MLIRLISQVWKESHTPVLVPQRLGVLWVHRLLRITHTNTLGELCTSFRTGPQRAVCLAVWGLGGDGNVAVHGRGMGFVCDWRPTDVAD